MMVKKLYHEKVAEEVIEALKKGTAPWIKPWAPGHTPVVPCNAATNNPYHGANRIYLELCQPNDDPRWCTYRQAQKLGAQVRKGETGYRVQYWIFRETVKLTDGKGKPAVDAQGKQAELTVLLENPKVIFSTVFHASQIDGLSKWQTPASIKLEWDPQKKVEELLIASGAKIVHDQQDQAYYKPRTDTIHLPAKSQFSTADAYYATALHELGHWTGHPDRLDRKGGADGTADYAKEELRAEIASYMLGTKLGIGHDPGQHTAYIKSWIEALQDDPKEMLRAAAAAEKIQKYVLGHGWEQAKDQVKPQTQAPKRALRKVEQPPATQAHAR